MTLAELLATREHKGGEPTPEQKLSMMRVRVAEGHLLESLRQHQGWPLLERELTGQIDRDRKALVTRMAVKSFWRSWWDGDSQAAARIEGMQRALDTVDGFIHTAVEAERTLERLK